MVNDPAERRVKLIQDFISTSTDENLTKKEMKNLKLINLVAMERLRHLYKFKPYYL